MTIGGRIGSGASRMKTARATSAELSRHGLQAAITRPENDGGGSKSRLRTMSPLGEENYQVLFWQPPPSEPVFFSGVQMRSTMPLANPLTVKVWPLTVESAVTS